jgi:2-oxoglutarate ferredoxin oxidoreductase subunit beta
VFRTVERPSYDEEMSAQIEAARLKQGDGDLAELLAGNDTWQVG